MTKQIIRLAPVKENPDDFAELEKEILRVFRKMVYGPLLRELGVKDVRLANAKGPKIAGLRDAVAAGTVVFHRGRFTGQFNADVSRDLRQLGATWDKDASAYRIEASALPKEIREAIRASADKFQRVLSRIDEKIRQFLPAEIAGKVDSKNLFESSLWKTDRKVDNTVKSISVLPRLTPDRAAMIADGWRNNLERWIKDFAAEEIPKLRDQIQAHVMAGRRYEDVVKTLQMSYGVTQRKARFLARQETGLLMAKFKEARYADAGIHEYQWRCVAGSPKHPVRPAHKALNGSLQRFDRPPVTTMPGEPERRNNPGEDFNCRCTAVPVVRKEKRA